MVPDPKVSSAHPSSSGRANFNGWQSGRLLSISFRRCSPEIKVADSFGG
jgi:hypothetical protein